jgi:biopolymer transport protein ExbB
MKHWLTIVLSTFLFHFLCIPASAGVKVPTFEEAFQREIQELTATRDALAKSLTENTKQAESQKQMMSQKIEHNLRELELLQQQKKRLEEQRDFSFEAAQKHEDDNALFDAMLRTASETASKKMHSSDLSAEETFSWHIHGAIDTLKKHSTVVSQKGTFFSKDSKETSGTIIYIGDIAALGISNGSGSVLMRTAEGDLIATADVPSESVESLARGEKLNPVLVAPFSQDAMQQSASKDLWQITEAGGPVAFVILAIAVLGILLVLERIFTLLLHSNYVPSSFQRISELIAANRFEDALLLSKRMGAVGKALRYVLENRSLKREEMENGISELVLRTLPKMDRSLTILTVITSVAPLLGLLGTVTGMISTFDVITQFGTGNPALLSGGISEALITTKFGLAVAVPFLLARSLIARWAKTIVANMQTYCLAAINIVKKGDPL